MTERDELLALDYCKARGLSDERLRAVAVDHMGDDDD